MLSAYYVYVTRKLDSPHEMTIMIQTARMILLYLTELFNSSMMRLLTWVSKHGGKTGEELKAEGK